MVESRTATVVVGVDGSEGSLAALRFAAREAELRGARLVVLHAWTTPLLDALPEPWLVPLAGLPSHQDEGIDAACADAQRVLDAACAALPDGLRVEPRLVPGRPARALLAAAGGADLLVVGARGRGLAGLRLGSVSRRCAEHASCPVTVVPLAGVRAERAAVAAAPASAERP